MYPEAQPGGLLVNHILWLWHNKCQNVLELLSKCNLWRNKKKSTEIVTLWCDNGCGFFCGLQCVVIAISGCAKQWNVANAFYRPYHLRFYGIDLVEEVLRDWLRKCGRQAPSKKAHRSRESLSKGERKKIQVGSFQILSAMFNWTSNSINNLQLSISDRCDRWFCYWNGRFWFDSRSGQSTV